VGGSLGDLNSANRYTYANDDPVNATDPSGKASCAASWALWFAAVAISIAVLFVTAGTAALIIAVLGAELANLIATDTTFVACTGHNLF
jgi:hypothetical protein